jgi:hypothetical protein
MSPLQKSAVSVQPNEARIRGKIVGVKPDGAGSSWEVALEEVRDVEGMPNFAQSEVGKKIKVYAHPEIETDLTPGDAFEAKIAFRGDERGGRFVLAHDDFRKL